MNQTTHPELLEILRIDYQRVLAEIGMKPEQVRAMVENESDQMPMPPGFEHLEMRPSPIQGRGMFTTKNFTKGQRIGPGNVGGMRTPLGRYMNHSPWPNTEFRVLPDGGIDAYALEDSPAGAEILNDYRQGARRCRVPFDAHEVEVTLSLRAMAVQKLAFV